MISSLLVLLTLAAPAIDQDAADASQPQVALATAIPHALALIESKQYKKFIRQYAVPSQLQKVLKQKTLDEIVRGFAKDHAARIILILKEIQKKQRRESQAYQNWSCAYVSIRSGLWSESGLCLWPIQSNPGSESSPHGRFAEPVV